MSEKLLTIDVYCKLCGEKSNRGINIPEANLPDGVARALKSAMCPKCRTAGIFNTRLFEAEVQEQIGELDKKSDPFWQMLERRDEQYAEARRQRIANKTLADREQTLKDLKEDQKANEKQVSLKLEE